MAEQKGLLIVYTGPGKGKTTCALGTAFRAVGQGLRVLMIQFIKGSWHYGELDAAEMLGKEYLEINYVISYGMLDAEKVVSAFRSRPEGVHVICTGRNAHPALVEAADLVTEMREVKHPYTKGILAQRGIDY
jgi:cob(I)alamin adenosyltransferase